MKKNFVITIFICLLNLTTNGQCQNEYFENKKYPGICVENTIKWLNMSRSDWYTEMRKFEFHNDAMSDEGPYFSSSDEHWDVGVQYVITKDFGKIMIENIPIGDFKKNIFEKIVGELEPYFREKKGELNIFRFQYSDNISYEFVVYQSRMIDKIWVKKYN